jgi:hypothetical protein
MRMKCEYHIVQAVRQLVCALSSDKVQRTVRTCTELSILCTVHSSASGHNGKGALSFPVTGTYCARFIVQNVLCVKRTWHSMQDVL